MNDKQGGFRAVKGKNTSRKKRRDGGKNEILSVEKTIGFSKVVRQRKENPLFVLDDDYKTSAAYDDGDFRRQKTRKSGGS